MASETLSPLRLLGQIINDSIDIIEERLAEASVSFPSLDDPFNPTSKVESILVEPDIISATSHIVAAAAQLLVTVRHPVQTVFDDSLRQVALNEQMVGCTDAPQFLRSSCIRAAIDGSLVEIVREAGAQGIHVNDIAAKNNTDPLKVARILRFLSNHHIFREITPNVFASNRLSSVLDSGKPSKETVANTADRHIFVHLVLQRLRRMTADEMMKSAAYLPEAFLDPKLSFSIEPNETSLNMAFGTKMSLFEWYNQKDPESVARSQRFRIAMTGMTKMEPETAILSGFQWKDLPEGSTIVDVGGGVGSSSLIIAKTVPHLNIVIQDQPQTIADAKEFWITNMPSAISSGRVKLQVHDFFQPQPIKVALAFLLRFIMHDWADPYAKKILKSLRASATPETKLIIVDCIVSYSCNAAITEDIPGAVLPPVPAPLLPSFGKANSLAYQIDLQMWVSCNGPRTYPGPFRCIGGQTVVGRLFGFIIFLDPLFLRLCQFLFEGSTYRLVVVG
ncbi:S-adenosyl-L-methionine-dependent methyltransferase [Gymnopus androsaceus JB14]|uniref:S-adenosyl-L-methionine-dependent methyltransferase n=1 Tax=Gymnopus androsaceus JB14 TaxID=1447944 RepID=A0A6A4H7N1_9AGAR|nr:S-adenosyl-L-methionine-dependent methyltransferase [Gymnopus androsaceus JB14]